VFVAERYRAAGLAARSAFKRADWVTACSEDLRSRAVAIGAGQERSNVIPYGVDSERFRPGPDLRARGREILGLADNVPLVFAVGRLVRKKGFEYLIDAAAALKTQQPALRVAIAGNGDLESSLRARARAAGVGEAVQFLGVVSHHAVPALLAAADVAVAPSVHDDAGNVDGLPNTVMEIMASGTPLVATPAGGISAVATDGITARLVPERDVPALAAAIDELLRDRSIGTRIGGHARDFVCRHHSWARVAEDFETVYLQCAR
jgi:glycosyltransferase involved in cell wall biosynthesis